MAGAACSGLKAGRSGLGRIGNGIYLRKVRTNNSGTLQPAAAELKGKTSCGENQDTGRHAKRNGLLFLLTCDQQSKIDSTGLRIRVGHRPRRPDRINISLCQLVDLRMRTRLTYFSPLVKTHMLPGILSFLSAVPVASSNAGSALLRPVV